MPSIEMPSSKFYCFSMKPDMEMLAGYDTCVVQRCSTQQQYDLLTTFKQLDMKIVYDLDDDVWDLPEYNPAHQQLNAHREGFKHCIRMVDAVTVSTKTLANIVRKNVPKMVNAKTGKVIPIFVVENRINENIFAVPRKADKTIVGWAGSTSHSGDLPLLEKAVLTNAAEFPDVVFEFRGHAPGSGPFGIKSELPTLPNYRFMPWSAVPEFGARMPLWGWSVALAPVTTHPFNESKSCIKMLEAAYCKIPCLASWIRPYDEFCSCDPDLKWLLCPGESAWTNKLRELLNDPARRDALGNKMHEVMRREYSFTRPHEGWETVFSFLRTEAPQPVIVVPAQKRRLKV